MKPFRLLPWLLLLYSVVAALPVFAEVPPAAQAAPRVGLVLAGGGARGLAHIGVIRYLEQNRIKVHAVAGTSMGAIVGGLYASGMSAAQIEEVVKNFDWQRSFNDSTPRDQLSFRRKEEDYDFLVSARLRYKDGRFRLPLGLVEGQNLNLMLHELVAHVSDITDFDALPIPFRAVATDLASGEAVVLDHGDLATAMLASMSIPSAFAPVDLDGRLLADGGIARNVPVDVVQAMGVDRLIVVDVGTPLYTRDELESRGGLAVIDQLTTLLTRKNSEQQLALLDSQDILVRPDLKSAEITTMGFDKAELAISLGYQSAAAMHESLAALVVDPGETYVAHELGETTPPLIEDVVVTTDAPVSRSLLRNMLTQREGAVLDRKQLEHDIADIYGLDEFSRVEYEIRKVDAKQVLVVNAIAHSSGTSYLKIGISWDQDSRGDSEFGVRASWRQKGVNRLGAEWYTLAQLGGRSTFATEFYQPLDENQRFFVVSKYQYQQRLFNVSDDGEVRARALVDDHLLELAPGINLSNIATLRAGAFTGSADTDIQVGSPLLTSSSEDDGGYFAELRYDTLDRAFFPGRGMRLVSRYAEGSREWGSQTDYDAWDTALNAVYSIGRTSVSANARWSELDIDADIPTLPSQVFSLGGFLSLSGYTRDSLAGNYLGMASLVFYTRLTDQSLLPVDMPVYAGGSLEAGNTWFERENAGLDDLIYAGSLFLGVDSPLGPVFLGLGLAENNQRALYLQMGQVFD